MTSIHRPEATAGMSWSGRLSRRLLVAVLGAMLVLGGVAFALPSAAHADTQPSYRITLDMSECGVMAEGVTGTCIISLQTWLNIFDQANLVVDGMFGPATYWAVVGFQERHGLVADGRFGDDSRNALRGVYELMMENSVATPEPAVRYPGTGVNRDPGEAIPGWGGGLIQSFGCGAVGELAGGLATDFFCEIVLS